jgi:hypothetical protein
MITIPNSPGIWEAENGFRIDVYPLEPVDNILCVWCQDVGINLDTSDIWSTDEWLGHIPVCHYVNLTKLLWKKIE